MTRLILLLKLLLIVVSVTKLGSKGRGFESKVSLEVMGSDGICKHLSCLSLTLCYCMRAFLVSVCINYVTALWTPGA